MARKKKNKKSDASKTPSSKSKSSKKKKKEEEFICEFCKKVYKSRSGLSKHKKKCPIKDVESEEEPAELPIEEELETLSKEFAAHEGEEEEIIDIESQLDQQVPEPGAAGGDDASLKGQLESELQRLQEEYKRQKDETEKLQRERAALQREREEMDTIITEKVEVEKQKMLTEFGNGKGEGESTGAPGVSDDYSSGEEEGMLAEVEDRKPISMGASDDASGEEAALEPQEEPPMYDEGPSADDDHQEDTTNQYDDYSEPEEAGGFDHDSGSSASPSVLPEVYSSKLSDIETQYEDQAGTISRISGELNDLRSSVDVVSTSKLSSKFELISQRFKRIEEDFRKQSDKLTSVTSEIGIGEVIDVAKVPPDILETVYEATLNDIVEQMRLHVGAQGMDKIVSEILESIRKQTSGSELFFFDGHKIRTRKLATFIERKLISARQVQTTYETFVKRLIEFTLNYQPKNFKAMVSIKSQEYAVNNSRLLRVEIDQLREDMDGMKSDIYRLEDVLNEKLNIYSKELEARFTDLREEVSSLKNSNIMFTEDIRKIIEKFEGEDISLDSLAEMNRNLSERLMDLENAQNINVARFSAIERRILDEGESISDLVEEDVDVDASIIKRPEEVEEVEETPPEEGSTEETVESVEETPEETMEKVQEEEEPSSEAETVGDEEKPLGEALEEILEEEVTEEKEPEEREEEETELLEKVEETPTELVEETIVEEAPFEIDFSKGTIELGGDDDATGDTEEDLEEPEMDFGSIILGLVSEGYDSKTQIIKTLKKREIKINKSDVERSLEELVESDMINAEKKGRYFKYLPKDDE